jgi:hypothetical protein
MRHGHKLGESVQPGLDRCAALELVEIVGHGDEHILGCVWKVALWNPEVPQAPPDIVDVLPAKSIDVAIDRKRAQLSRSVHGSPLVGVQLVRDPLSAQNLTSIPATLRTPKRCGRQISRPLAPSKENRASNTETHGSMLRPTAKLGTTTHVIP